MASWKAFGLLAAFAAVNASPLAQASGASSNAAPAASAAAPVKKITNFTGPLFDHGLRDPCILHSGGHYYTYSTNSGSGKAAPGTIPPGFKNVPMVMSDTDNITGTWTVSSKDAMPSGTGAWTANPSGGPDTAVWNPDVDVLDDGTFVMYYSAKQTKIHNERCIGVAYSKNVTGPFVPNDDPLYCPPSGGAIGVSAIKDGNKRYVVFKDGSNEQGGSGSHVGLLPVNYDKGAPILRQDPYLLTNEKGLKYGYEGPTITKMPNGKYLMLHTTGLDRKNYQIVYATADTITQEPYDEGTVLLSSPDTSNDGTKVWIPGGPDFIGDSNTRFIFFADPDSPSDSNNTRLYYGELEYTNTGAPSVKRTWLAGSEE